MSDPTREGDAAIALDDDAVEIARLAVEDLLVEFRDSRIGILLGEATAS